MGLFGQNSATGWTLLNNPLTYLSLGNPQLAGHSLHSGLNGLKQSDEGQDMSSVFSDFMTNQGKILETYMNAMSNSAMSAENAAAEKQMAFQREANQKAMDFSASEAEKNRIFQQNSAKKAMDFEKQQAQDAMAFSERMSNTAYQRAVADMQSAGINPILAYTQGGASAPAGIAGSGFSSSGSSASGVSSSGSKANVSSGKSADLSVFKNVFTSAGALLSALGSALYKANK